MRAHLKQAEICLRNSFQKAEIVCSATCCDFNDFAKAMANETRQRILSLLQAGELNESDIVTHFDLAQPTISHHLALLQNVNLVKARRDGKYIYYHVNSDCVSQCCSKILARYNLPSTEA